MQTSCHLPFISTLLVTLLATQKARPVRFMPTQSPMRQKKDTDKDFAGRTGGKPDSGGLETTADLLLVNFEGITIGHVELDVDKHVSRIN